jgi:hypothetical protein
MTKREKNTKMNIFKLDMQILTGKLSTSTPIIIVEIVANFYKIAFNEEYWSLPKYVDNFNTVFRKIAFKVLEINKENENEISKFLNVEPENAINVLNSVLNDEFEKITTNDLLLCYFICRKLNYPMNINTQQSEIIFASKCLLNKTKISNLRSDIIENAKTINDEDAIKIAYEISLLPKGEKRIIELNEIKNTSTKEQLNHKINVFSSVDYLLERIIPMNDTEAILLAFKRFNINLNSSSCPLKQFKFLSKYKINLDNYVPVDDSLFCSMYRKNPKWFIIDNEWDNDLLSLYSEKQIYNFCINEGYTNDKFNLKNGIEFLENTTKNITFFFGINPFCSVDETLYKLSFSEIPENQLISIGYKNNPKSLYYTTVEELTSYFNSSKMFTDPLNYCKFSNISIIKLKNYLKRFVADDKDRLLFFQLLETIKEVENVTDIINVKVEELSFHIKTMDVEDNMKVEAYFKNIINMAFYMRGWKINDDKYPLSSVDTNFDIKDSSKVYQNTWDAYKNVIDSLNDISFKYRIFVEELNLIRYTDMGTTQKIFDMKFKGVVICPDNTLLNCVKKSIKPDDNDNDTCIRSNSNWILFTASWYCYIFGFSLDFKFDNIDIIL